MSTWATESSRPWPGIVDPDIDVLEVMQSERENAVDLFRVANVAGERYGSFGVPDSRTSGFSTGGIA